MKDDTWQQDIIRRLYKKALHLTTSEDEEIDILVYIPRGSISQSNIKHVSLKTLEKIIESEGYGK